MSNVGTSDDLTRVFFLFFFLSMTDLDPLQSYGQNVTKTISVERCTSSRRCTYRYNMQHLWHDNLHKPFVNADIIIAIAVWYAISMKYCILNGVKRFRQEAIATTFVFLSIHNTLGNHRGGGGGRAQTATALQRNRPRLKTNVIV